MTAEPFYLSAWTTLPMVGQTYEFNRGGETFVGQVEVAKITGQQRLLIVLADGKIVNTILPVGYRPCVEEPRP